MKKLLAGIFALTLAASMSIPALAANTETNNGGDTSIPVNGTYQAGVTAEVISVDLAWDAMDFTYTEGSKGTWKPETHTYDGATAGAWAATGGTNPEITVTNHSNVDIQASFTFNSDIQNLFPSFSSETLVVDSAVDTDPASAPKDKISFYVYGSGATIDADQKLGNVTVTITKFDTTPKMISTAEELFATRAQTGVFKLANDIDLGDSGLYIDSGKYVLDLNGYTISGNSTTKVININDGSKATIKNGTVKGTNTDSGIQMAITATESELILENCKVFGYSTALQALNGTVHITNCEFNNTKNNTITNGFTCNMTLSGDVKVKGGSGFSKSKNGTVTALPGTYNFDISSYVDTTLYDVSNDGTTWTVTAK